MGALIVKARSSLNLKGKAQKVSMLYATDMKKEEALD